VTASGNEPIENSDELNPPEPSSRGLLESLLERVRRTRREHMRADDHGPGAKGSR
jgi:hypothetical protein